MRRLVLAVVLALVTLAAGSEQAALAAPAAAADRPLPQAEIFATNNTATITDLNDPRLRTHLRQFELQVDGMIIQGDEFPVGSTLLNGVFFDGTQLTYERSREFAVDHSNPTRLCSTARAIAVRYSQDSVLTFRFLPQTSVENDPDGAVQVELPGVSVQTLHDALQADPAAENALGGGSVTLNGKLTLIGDIGTFNSGAFQDFVVNHLHGAWSAATIHFGDWQFVGQTAAC